MDDDEFHLNRVGQCHSFVMGPELCGHFGAHGDFVLVGHDAIACRCGDTGGCGCSGHLRPADETEYSGRCLGCSTYQPVA